MIKITYYPQDPISKCTVEKIRQEAQRHLTELNALLKEMGYWKDHTLGLTLKFEDYPDDVEVDGRMLWTHHTFIDTNAIVCQDDTDGMVRVLRDDDLYGDDVEFLDKSEK